MKRTSTLLSFACAAVLLALGGCAQLHNLNERLDAQRQAPAAAPAPVSTAARAATPGIETIPFRMGVSSATVEKMARQQGCTGGQGAALVTEPGPVEVYRMRCEEGAMRGKEFKARCELRQCRAM